MKEYTMLVSKHFSDYFNAVLEVQYKPSEEANKRLKQLGDENTKRLDKSQEKAEIEFLKLYAKETLEFLKTISKPYFLVGEPQFSQSWIIKSDDNDDYWSVNFRNGKFNYVIDICGGYAGTEIIEENISFERVTELLETKQGIKIQGV